MKFTPIVMTGLLMLGGCTSQGEQASNPAAITSAETLTPTTKTQDRAVESAPTVGGAVLKNGIDCSNSVSDPNYEEPSFAISSRKSSINTPENEEGESSSINQDSINISIHKPGPKDTAWNIARLFFRNEVLPGNNGYTQRTSPAFRSLRASNPGIKDLNNIPAELNGKETVINVAISTPQIVTLEKPCTVEGIAAKTGFKAITLLAINEHVSTSAIIPAGVEVRLPINDFLPDLSTTRANSDKKTYVVQPNDTSYIDIAKKTGTALGYLLGKNNPPADKLMAGDLLNIDPTETTIIEENPAATTTTTAAIKRAPEVENTQKIKELISQRYWTSYIDEKKNHPWPDEAFLEDKILAEKLKGIVFEPGEYEQIVAGIDYSFLTPEGLGPFEVSNRGILKDNVIDSPECRQTIDGTDAFKANLKFFIIHNTAAAFGDGVGAPAVVRLISSMKRRPVGVHYTIDLEGKIYSLASKNVPSLKHLKPMSGDSAGVEIMTTESRAGGDLNVAQLKAAIALSEKFRRENMPNISVDKAIAGHAELVKEITAGSVVPICTDGTKSKPSSGKIDFDKISMDAFRDAQEKLSLQLDNLVKKTSKSNAIMKP
jgi:LysM repeat protein